MSQLDLALPSQMYQKPTIKIKASEPDLLPFYATQGAAGADIKASISLPIILQPQHTALIPTGLFLEIPYGWEVQIRPRSGLALKFGVTVLNTPGTIDSDYRGEIQVILINLGKEAFHIEPKMRIAQMVIAPAHQAIFNEVQEVKSTHRGSGGFGHTGLH